MVDWCNSIAKWAKRKKRRGMDGWISISPGNSFKISSAEWRFGKSVWEKEREQEKESDKKKKREREERR
tara:strand:- start:320 stop:526 length:207 start_codon:yes stop_codon:yes gene_type:complete